MACPGVTLIRETPTGSHALAAARLLSQAVTFSNISLSKTKAILGRPMDISKDADSDDENEVLDSITQNTDSRYEPNEGRRRSSSMRRINEERDIMLNQARTFRDFQNLFTAVDALEEWAALAQKAKKYVHQCQESLRSLMPLSTDLSTFDAGTRFGKTIFKKLTSRWRDRFRLCFITGCKIQKTVRIPYHCFTRFD